MIDRNHALPIVRQAELVGISRGGVYYLPRTASAADQQLMKRIDALNLAHPFAGSRMLRDMLNREGFEVDSRRVGEHHLFISLAHRHRLLQDRQ